MPDITQQDVDTVTEGLSALCDDDEVVTRWVAFFEVIENDGRRDIRGGHSDGWLPSEINGVLWDGLNGEILDDDEDDEEV